MIFLVGLVGLIAFGATEARAQVFRPRGGSKSGPVSRASTPTGPPAGARKATPAATPAAASSKKPTRATGPAPRRIVTTTPAKKARGTGKGRDEPDDPVVIDDDDDDVKITDD